MKFEPIEGERQCKTCGECKPLPAFRGTRKQCRECGKRRQLARYHATKGNRGAQLWRPTDSEIEIIRREYPSGGSVACLRFIRGKTASQISGAARKRRIRYLGPHAGGSAPDESAEWPVPAHDYCEADLALRDWRAAMPVVGTFAPGLGMRVAA